MVCHIGGQLGTKVVISALRMLALYMRFNGTGIWGGETRWTARGSHSFILLQTTAPTRPAEGSLSSEKLNLPV